jgi:hypothetical protein
VIATTITLNFGVYPVSNSTIVESLTKALKG